MAVDVVTETVIARGIDQVVAFAADPSTTTRWYARIDEVAWLSPPPVQVGSRLAFVAHLLGRRLSYTYEVVEHVPSERLVMRTEQGPFPMETTYTWTALGPDRTRMTLRNRGEPAGFSRCVAPFVGPAVRRANRQDLARLRRLLEQPDGSPG